MTEQHGIWERIESDVEGKVRLRCTECGTKKYVTEGSWRNREKPTRGAIFRISKTCKHVEYSVKVGDIKGVKRVVELVNGLYLIIECIHCDQKSKVQRGNWRNSGQTKCECMRKDSTIKRHESDKLRESKRPMSSNDAFLAKFDEDAIAEKGSQASRQSDKKHEVRNGVGRRFIGHIDSVTF